MTKTEFGGTTTVITGAARGQGEAEAWTFARAGSNVVLCDINEEAGERVAAQIRQAGLQALFRRLDVVSENDWAGLASEIAASGIPIRTLVNNAGVLTRTGRLMNAELDEWQRVMDINVKGPLLGIRAFAPQMRDAGGGSIINTGSIAALNGHFMTLYTTSKWALRGLSRSAAVELAPWKIRVNSVHPGYIDTPMAAGSPALTAAMMAHTPIGRPGTVEDIARVVLFLAGEGSAFMTGQDVAVDGGFTNLGLFSNVRSHFDGQEK